MTDLELIKQKIDIVSLISESVVLKKTGANFKGLCPFHTEKTPSFIVSPERQIWHCFGGCQDGGDIFKFVMKMENVEFAEALQILAKRAGVKLSSYTPSKTTELREKIFAINHLASEFYNYILTSHPLGEKARKYLAGRKISADSIKLFGIGYAPNSWNSLVNFLGKKSYTTADLETAGLVSKSGIGNFFDRFRGRVIFTLRDHRGNVVGFAGRLLDPEAKEAKYINTAETPVYVKGDVLYGLDTTKEDIKKEGFAVVVEGEIDAIASYQAGVRNIVAIKGSALTEGQVSLLKRYTEKVYLSLDADFAGDAAAHRGITIADAAGLDIKVVSVIGAKDPDELVKKDPGLWRNAIKEATSFYDFIIDSAKAKYDPSSAEGGKKIVAEVAKFLVPIDNLVVKNHYLKKLATILDLPQDDLETQLDKEWRKAQIARLAEVSTPPPQIKSRSLLLEEYLLTLLLQSTKPADYLLLISSRVEPSDFQTPALGKIYQLLLSFVDNPKSDVTLSLSKGQFSIKEFVKLVPPELLDTVDRLYLSENIIGIASDADIVAEVQKTAWELKELSLREKLKKISAEIKKDEDSGQLEKDFTDASAALSKLIEERGLISAGA